jgi:transcriptional regulator with XRE-family HTH domain
MRNQNSDIAKKTGIKYKYLSMIEKGNLTNPSTSIVKEILDLLDIKIPDLHEN